MFLHLAKTALKSFKTLPYSSRALMDWTEPAETSFHTDGEMEEVAKWIGDCTDSWVRQKKNRHASFGAWWLTAAHYPLSAFQYMWNPSWVLALIKDAQSANIKVYSIPNRDGFEAFTQKRTFCPCATCNNLFIVTSTHSMHSVHPFRILCVMLIFVSKPSTSTIH